MRLEGKVALITAAGQGIGRATALAYAGEGATVWATDINAKTLGTLDEIPGITTRVLDVTNTDAIRRVVAETGPQDILFNCAGFVAAGAILECSEEDWDFVVGNALKGYFLCSQRAAREMVKQGQGGRIVSISSVHAFRAWPGDLVYGVCKMGLVRMAKSMALDLAGSGITCNCVAPGYIDSRLLPPEREHLRAGPGYAEEAKSSWIPSRRGGVPNDIAGAVMFLCSDLGDYVNGQCITVDGGLLTGGTPSG